MKHVCALALVVGLFGTACSTSASAGGQAAAPASETTKTLSVGDPAPAFSLPDTTGNDVSLRSLTASGPAVLVFYRGDW